MTKVAIVGGGILGSSVESALGHRGHEVVVLSRRTGFDVTKPETMTPRPDIDAVVEATDVFTQKFDVARKFFQASTRNINHWAQESGISKHVLISIVNCEVDAMSSNGYYAGNAAQEKVALEENHGTVLVRSTLWYEFARKNLNRMKVGPFAIVPQMKVKPVALDAVAEVVAECIDGERQGKAYDVCGPEVMSLWSMTRVLRNKGALPLSVPAPGPAGKAMRQGALVPGPSAETVGPRFDEWFAEGDR
ncbi:hypothetical protein GCM10007147_42370 [Nocardiopsis kunsanensis]|uniref:Uncharacterized protein n=1 Tax=Nocardiopsis kunsanensis TaxID=141693 RepID=A0A918XK74_9ACTN|nr:hypothetical protein GCM10007147_42370 [Nocardiopsis kunsanensis]